MSYPGSPDKDPKVQQRILAAFREAVRLYQDGHRDECQTVLHSILEVDPAFRPAQRLEAALVHGQEVDLASLLQDLAGETSSKVEELLAQAKQALAAGAFGQAAQLAQQVLRELPGHGEAKSLLQKAQASLKAASEVPTQLARAREALAAGLVEEAKGFLRLVKQVSPDHPELAELEAQVNAPTPRGVDVEFETFTPPPVSAEAEAGVGPQEEEAAPELEVPWEAAARPTAGLSFDAVPQAPAFAVDEERVASPEEKIEALLAEGQEAFDRGDYDGAVQIWSRIYLLDANHQEAERRIEQAKRRLDEINRLVEMKFAEASEAFEQGQRELARKLLEEILALQPQHVDANDLLARLETPEAPPPLPTDLPAVEEDLFRDDFVPQEISSGAAPAVGTVAEERPMPRPARPAQAPRRLSLPLPLPVLVGVGLAVVVLLVVALFVRGKVWPSGPKLEDTLAEAEKLAQQGQLKDAINLLQALNLEGEQAHAVQQRLLEYQRRLRAQAPPAPALDLAPLRQALEGGKFFTAARLARTLTKKASGDPELGQLVEQIKAYDRLLPSLAEAWERSNWEGAATLCDGLLQAHPQDQELLQAWQVASFNRAVELLRSFQVAEAAKLLEALDKRAGDPEVARLLEFAKSYMARPTDPRYKIFVASLPFRQLPP